MLKEHEGTSKSVSVVPHRTIIRELGVSWCVWYEVHQCVRSGPAVGVLDESCQDAGQKAAQHIQMLQVCHRWYLNLQVWLWLNVGGCDSVVCQQQADGVIYRTKGSLGNVVWDGLERIGLKDQTQPQKDVLKSRGWGWTRWRRKIK